VPPLLHSEYHAGVVTKLSYLILAPLLLCSGLSCQTPAAKSDSIPPAARVERTGLDPSSAKREPLKLPLATPRIVVKKSARQLLLFSAGKLVRTYRVGLGLSPVGDKVRAGDHRTPEGNFYIFTKNSQSAFYLSLGVSYPNAEHAQRGLRDGLITKPQYARIIDAVQRKNTPPQNTRLGGTIYIHGRGAGSDWTWGCVALDDADIKELYDAVEVRTPVLIEP
jgi:murein L,D-transpeptidase YafK